MRGLYLIAACLWLASTPLALAAKSPTDSPCYHFYQDVSKRAESVFQDHASPIEKRRAVLSKLFEEAVDIPWIAREAAGPHWSTAKPAEQQAYLKQFHTYMLTHYVDKLDAESMDDMVRIELLAFDPTISGSFSARTQIVLKDDEPVSVDYILMETSGDHCQIRDFTVEGVDLLSVQREDMRSLSGLHAITNRLVDLTNMPAAQ